MEGEADPIRKEVLNQEHLANLIEKLNSNITVLASVDVCSRCLHARIKFPSALALNSLSFANHFLSVHIKADDTLALLLCGLNVHIHVLEACWDHRDRLDFDRNFNRASLQWVGH